MGPRGALDPDTAHRPRKRGKRTAFMLSVDINKGVIAAQTATIQAGYVASSGATLVEFATPDETIAAVRNGEADAVLADGDYLLPIVAESGGELVTVGQVGIGGGVGMGIRESDGDLKAKMDMMNHPRKTEIAPLVHMKRPT